MITSQPSQIRIGEDSKILTREHKKTNQKMARELEKRTRSVVVDVIRRSRQRIQRIASSACLLGIGGDSTGSRGRPRRNLAPITFPEESNGQMAADEV